MDGGMGKWAFIIGLIIAVLAGFNTNLSLAKWITLVLLVLGLIVGLLNVTGKESRDFLIAAIALTVGANAALTAVPAIGTYLLAILRNIVAFVAPAALVVALKSIYQLSSEQ